MPVIGGLWTPAHSAHDTWCPVVARVGSGTHVRSHAIGVALHHSLCLGVAGGCLQLGCHGALCCVGHRLRNVLWVHHRLLRVVARLIVRAPLNWALQGHLAVLVGCLGRVWRHFGYVPREWRRTRIGQSGTVA